MSKQYFVYILTNKNNTVLYTGVTNNLLRRVYEHREGIGGKFTRKYNVNKLVYYEACDDINVAIMREKQIKAGSRQKKIDLIVSLNPEWKDLYEEMKLSSCHCEEGAFPDDVYHEVASNPILTSVRLLRFTRNDTSLRCHCEGGAFPDDVYHEVASNLLAGHEIA